MYVNQNEAVNVYDLGLMLFRDEVLHHSLIRERLKTTLLAMVAQERRGEIVDRYKYQNGGNVEMQCVCVCMCVGVVCMCM